MLITLEIFVLGARIFWGAGTIPTLTIPTATIPTSVIIVGLLSAYWRSPAPRSTCDTGLGSGSGSVTQVRVGMVSVGIVRVGIVRVGMVTCTRIFCRCWQFNFLIKCGAISADVL